MALHSDTTVIDSDDILEDESDSPAGEILTVELRLQGIPGVPLLQHNERLVNRFDTIVQQIALITDKGKRQTEQDHLDKYRLEWEGGLYWQETVGPYIPAANIKKCFMEAAAIYRQGTAVKRAVIPLDDCVPLAYAWPGPAKAPKDTRSLDALWNAGRASTSPHGTFCDIRAVGINRNKVMRARPKFVGWSLTTQMLLQTNLLDIEKFKQCVKIAGQTTGLGDYRPTCGRFTAIVTVVPSLIGL